MLPFETMALSENFRIRPTQPEDISLLLQLIRELAEFERLSQSVRATEQGLSRALFGDSPSIHALLGELDGKAQAYALYFRNFSTFEGKPGIYLEDLYVRPAYRGQGMGRAMLAYLARLAVDSGCARLEWSVLNWNERASSFYKGLGAKVMDEWRMFRLSGQDLQNLGGPAS